MKPERLADPDDGRWPNEPPGLEAHDRCLAYTGLICDVADREVLPLPRTPEPLADDGRTEVVENFLDAEGQGRLHHRKWYCIIYTDFHSPRYPMRLALSAMTLSGWSLACQRRGHVIVSAGVLFLLAPCVSAQSMRATMKVGPLAAGEHQADVPGDTVGGAIPLSVVVEPGDELLGIMLWLSRSYPQPPDSRYKTAVWAHFGAYQNHPALNRLKRLSMYPDFTEAGLQLQGFPDARAVLPDSMSWYHIYTRDTTAAILADAVEFAAATGFWAFHEQHLPDYAEWAVQFEQGLAERGALFSLDSFFRYGANRPRPRVTVLIEPLNGWGAHAIDFQQLRGEPNGDRVTFMIGPQDETFPDSPLQFQATPWTVGTVWHEGSHVYLSSLIARSLAQIAEVERPFESDALARQNVTTWRYAFEENLVRAITAVLVQQVYGDDAYQSEVRSQIQSGFEYTGDLAGLISSEYVAHPERYSDFDAFFPRILTWMAARPTVSLAEAP